MTELTPTDIARAEYADLQRRAIHDGAPLGQVLIEWIGAPVAIRAVGEFGEDASGQTLLLPRIDGDAVAVTDIAVDDGQIVFGRNIEISATASAVTVRAFLLTGTKRSLRMRLPDPVPAGDGEAGSWPAGSLRF